MSQKSDHCLTLSDKLKQYPNNYKIVIDVFTTTIENQEWSDEDVIYMLSCSFGISNEIDVELQNQIYNIRKFMK